MSVCYFDWHCIVGSPVYCKNIKGNDITHGVTVLSPRRPMLD